MARTESDIVIAADLAAVMAVIADFDEYPLWATGMKSSVVTELGEDGLARDVDFVVSEGPIADEFTLRYSWAPASVSWRLVGEATMLTAMDGAYTLVDLGDGGTRVTYELEVDVKMPLLGLLKRKAEKVIIDTALKGLKRRVEQQSADGA